MESIKTILTRRITEFLRNDNHSKYSKLKSTLHYVFSPKRAPTGICLTFAQRRSGKTTDIAKTYLSLYKLYLKGECPYEYFYTNVKIPNADPNFYRYLDLFIFKFTDYVGIYDSKFNIRTIPNGEDTPYKIGRNCYIALDELGIIAHSRDYKSFPQEFISFTKLVGHFGIYMDLYSQAYDIDKGLRTACNNLVFMHRIGYFAIKRKLKKTITVTSKDENNNADSQICDKVEFESMLVPGSFSINFNPFYTDLFNSFD